MYRLENDVVSRLEQQSVLVPTRNAQQLLMSSTGLDSRRNTKIVQNNGEKVHLLSNIFVAALGSVLLVMLLSFGRPSQQEKQPSFMKDGGYLLYDSPPLPLNIIESSHVITKLEVTPTPGIGFGGLGVGPTGGGGFLPMPFGGFGMGFTVRHYPEQQSMKQSALTNPELLETQKQELQQVQQYEKSLEAQIKSVEKQQSKDRVAE